MPTRKQRFPATPTKRRATATAAPLPNRTFEGRLLDARRDRLDLRDRLYQPPLASLPPQFPTDADLTRYLNDYIAAGLVLDQGEEGACTGFGLAGVVNYLLWLRRPAASSPDPFQPVSARMFYHLARMYDEWPGEDYEGSSCRGALKGWHKHGVCSDALWPYRNAKGKIGFVEPDPEWASDALSRTLGVYYRVDTASIVEVQAAIAEIGAVYASAAVHPGWRLGSSTAAPTFANLPVIDFKPEADPTGGHAFALTGFDSRGFVVQNSWGRKWGLEGFAILTYEDWLKHSQDCWATALGVPVATDRRVKQARTTFARAAAQSPAPRSMAMMLDRPSGEAPAASLLPDDEALYRTVVLGNDGRPELRIVEHADAATSVLKLGNDIPARWLDETGSEHLLLYAHGGLNSEQASLNRVRVLGRMFQENGIYPLFITWRTGPIETIRHIVEDEFDKILKPFGDLGDVLDKLKKGAIEEKDRILEAVARRLVAKAMWDQMKQNAMAASDSGGGAALLGQALTQLRKARGNKLSLHIVGHSAGSIILAHMLQHLPALASSTLLAPACTVDLAVETYKRSIEKKQIPRDGFHVHLLSEEREQEDSVGPYGKSLLYLVSRALEAQHKTPLLGLERAFQPASIGTPQWNTEVASIEAAQTRTLTTWQGFFDKLPGAPKDKLHVENSATISTGSSPAAKPTPATHGCFDNHAGVMEAVMTRILGKKPRPIDDINY